MQNLFSVELKTNPTALRKMSTLPMSAVQYLGCQDCFQSLTMWLVAPGDSHFVTPSQPSLAATWALPGQLRQQRPNVKPRAKAGGRPQALAAAAAIKAQPAFSQPHQAQQAALGIFDFHAPSEPAAVPSPMSHAAAAAGGPQSFIGDA